MPCKYLTNLKVMVLNQAFQQDIQVGDATSIVTPGWSTWKTR